jgi:hypothetical protein
LAGRRVGLIFEIIIPVLGLGHGMLRWRGGTGFGPFLESRDWWLTVELREGGRGRARVKAVGRPVLGGSDRPVWLRRLGIGNVGEVLHSLEDKVVVPTLRWGF